MEHTNGTQTIIDWLDCIGEFDPDFRNAPEVTAVRHLLEGRPNLAYGEPAHQWLTLLPKVLRRSGMHARDVRWIIRRARCYMADEGPRMPAREPALMHVS